MTPGISIRGLRKAYGSTPVLTGLDLTCQAGRVYALLGRNGAGKSTTFKVLLGLLSPDAGEVHVLGEPWSRASLAQIGALVDGPALYGHLSARENLLVHARLCGIGAERIDPLLQTVGLGGVGRKRASSFSTGIKARLALALALLTDPPVLILDEPQNGLDPEGIIELRGLVRRLAAEGRTVLISSHQLGEVTHLADDIGVLVDGHLVYEGPLRQFAPEGDLEQAYLRATTGVAAAPLQDTTAGLAR